ncbi:MAG: DUF3570 domain-containing protein [Myxococcota bacterium]
MWLLLGAPAPACGRGGCARRARSRASRPRARRAAPAPPRRGVEPSPAVRALTFAALALPSLATATRAAGDDGFEVQFGRYQEGERDTAGVDTRIDPLRAETISARWRWLLGDRVRLALDYLQDTWSGATPVTTAPRVVGGNRPRLDALGSASPMINGDLFLDARMRPLDVDPFGTVLGVDERLVHTLSTASPETRHAFGAKLGYEWDAAQLEVGGSASLEPDYRALSIAAEGRISFDRKATTLVAGASYTNGAIRARLDHDAQPYIDTSAFADAIDIEASTGFRTLRDERHDVGVHLGLSRVLTRSAFVEFEAAWVRASGYLASPYRVAQVAFVDPAQQALAPPGTSYAQVRALLERVPRERNRASLSARLVQHVAALDASARLAYRFYADDWGVRSHALEASLAQPLGAWLTVTPRVRYATQGEADFYTTWLVSQQAYRTVVLEPGTGNVLAIVPFDPALLPRHYSTDFRLSGYGTLSAGASAELALARGVRLVGDAAYYAHRGDWKLGGGGEASFADFDAWMFGLSLAFDGSVLRGVLDGVDTGGDVHGAMHAASHALALPAGVMAAHMLDDAGDVMVGLRTMHVRRGGDLLRGSREPTDAEVVAGGCGPGACRIAPDRMSMTGVMLELMAAPTSWLTLALMPRFVGKEMELRNLAGGAPDPHGSHGHATGGLGDADLLALVRVLDAGAHHVHAGLGVGIPLGSVRQELRRTHQLDRGLVHYAMQLGSGTWDLLPSVTYTSALGRAALGAQLRGVVRLEDENAVGYALGDVVEATAWASHPLTSWLSASARAAFRAQGDIRGAYDRLHDDAGPMDFPANYGGRFWDVGAGLAARAPSGLLAGQTLRIEWMHPVATHVNGYQLDRRGELSVAWSAQF